MANISWKQIDTNGNGYVDGTERISAQVKGAKNVWDGMTELDFQSNTTREQKLALIKKSYNKWDGVIRQNVYVGSNAQEQRAKDKKDKEDELIQLHNKYEKYVSEHAEELAQLDGKMMNPFKALYKAGTANLKELSDLPNSTKQGSRAWELQIRVAISELCFFIAPHSYGIMDNMLSRENGKVKVGVCVF